MYPTNEKLTISWGPQSVKNPRKALYKYSEDKMKFKFIVVNVKSSVRQKASQHQNIDY